VSLALTSFSGTALLAPLILMGILSKKKPGLLIPICTILALLVFVLSLAEVVPGKFGMVDIRMILFSFLTIITGIEILRLKLR
jgi:SSS family solute:Na+ symporter